MNEREIPILIVGAGFGGLAMGWYLQQAGINDYLIIERASGLGGVWRANRYPGAACDVPARLYSFSFAQKADWQYSYPRQQELSEYQQEVAQRFGLDQKIEFETSVEQARWDDASKRWLVQTNQGVFRSRFLVGAFGLLSDPLIPKLPGIKQFAGQQFHSATWPEDADLNGKNAVVIGAAASAIQFVPEIAPQLKKLAVFQRTPNWLIPRPDRAITRLEKWLLKNVPPYRALMRLWVYLQHENRVFGIVVNPFFMKLFQRVAERHIRKQISDPALRQKVTPNYLIGCKRILISDHWYPALARNNVDLVTTGVREVRANSVVDNEGVEHPADVLIYGTGFCVRDSPMADRLIGKHGRTLAEQWQQGGEAYLGMAMPGFPNCFLLGGPNTGTGHTSMIYMLEVAARYATAAIKPRLRSDDVLEVRQSVHDEFNAKLQRKLAGSVWATGCESWYQHSSGKITALWPGFTFTYAWAARRFNRSDYI